MAWAIVVATLSAGTGGLVAPVAGVALIATVFAAVYHAEVVAHRAGEPFGTLFLAVAFTVIEVALIVSATIAVPAETAGLARDTVFAAVMIVMNGVVGVCLVRGGVLHHEQEFQLRGASAALAVLIALTTLLFVPNVIVKAGPRFGTSQLLFVATVSLVLYGSFVFLQTMWHRSRLEAVDEETHAPPSNKAAATSAGLLLVSLVAVVGLAKSLTPTMEAGISWLGMPNAVIGIVIAAVVLLPDSLAALDAAKANRLQTSMNLALGSLFAGIGLTIPTVVLVAIVIGQPLEIGLDDKGLALLVLTLFTSVITLSTGRTTVVQGIVHLVIFAVFLFFAVVPQG